MTSNTWNIAIDDGRAKKDVKLTVISRMTITLILNGQYIVVSDQPVDNNKIKANVYFQDVGKWFGKSDNGNIFLQADAMTLDLTKNTASINSRIPKNYRVSRNSVDGGYVFILTPVINPFGDVPETLTNDDRLQDQRKIIDNARQQIRMLEETIRKAEMEIRRLRNSR